MSDFLVKRDDLRQCLVADTPSPEVGPGQALLRVDSFGLTANNVTYAVMGEAMSYWDFFPAKPGWGRVPMWGFAEVERSEVDGVEAGTRVYGYLPPSSYLAVTPVSVEAGGFVDGSPHREKLPSAYHRYLAAGADPFYDAGSEDVQMLLRPLFFTSFLIDDQLADEGLVGSGPVVISSASSKTALAAAFLLARREGAELIGLTSPRSAEFVASLGIYDRTVPYDAIHSLEPESATFVDIAGDAAVRRAVHTHYGDELAHSMAVGVTHWEEFGAGGAEPLPGPTPTFFFAPDRVTKRAADWGRANLEQRVAEAWHPFCDWIAGWLEINHGSGFDAVRTTYIDVLEGRVDPKTAHVLTLASA
jgi:NADPH:quinone reductase-like Zn-dependent oxidoreductase